MKRTHCRISNQADLVEVLNLGNQYYSGYFPKTRSESVPQGELSLCISPSSGLLQLADEFPQSELYGDNYGYRSGLNQAMVSHLRDKVSKIHRFISLCKGDIVVDIGSNDGTLLSFYEQNLTRVGIDPTCHRFSEFYEDTIIRVPAFFDDSAFSSLGFGDKAKVVSSISMFYDLPDPVRFVEDVYSVLSDDGIWMLEQSYMPHMLATNSYDTICHEHIEYYSFTAIFRILDKVGFSVVDIAFNGTNGGSIEIVAAKKTNASLRSTHLVGYLLESERMMHLDAEDAYKKFAHNTIEHRESLSFLIKSLNKSGQRVGGLGASTKGNVLLQYCGLTDSDIFSIGDVNHYKHGRFTPGSAIPIISEEDILAEKPDYLIVLPWHFRNSFILKFNEYLSAGGKLIFPLPFIEIYG